MNGWLLLKNQTGGRRDPSKAMNNKTAKAIQGIIVLILAVIAVLKWPELRHLKVEDILGLMPDSPFVSALILLGLYCLKPVFMFMPLALLYMCAGILFTPFWALLLTCFFLAVETSLSYFIGRYLGRDRIHKLLDKSKYARKLVEFSQNKGMVSCFVIRFSPGPPVDVTSMLLGAAGIRYRDYLAGTVLGLIPGMVPFVLMGKAISNPLSAEFLIPLGISALLMLLAALIYHLYRNRKSKKEKTGL